MHNKLKELRVRHNLTQENLAKNLGVSRQTIHAIEKGKIIPSLKIGLKIAGNLGYSVEEIFQLEKESPEPKEPEKEFYNARKQGYL